MNIINNEITLYSKKDSYLRNLPGFIKGRHTVPKEFSSYHNTWIKNLATEIIDHEISEILEELRGRLKFKRTDFLNKNIHDGVGYLETKYFDYRIEIEQSCEDPGSITISRFLENYIHNKIIENVEFNLIFKNKFEIIKIPVSTPLDMEALIDRVEEYNDEKVLVNYDPFNLTNCSINMLDHKVVLLCSPDSIEIIKKDVPTPDGLMKILSIVNRFFADKSGKGFLF